MAQDSSMLDGTILEIGAELINRTRTDEQGFLVPQRS
jgi:hypothetical protein